MRALALFSVALSAGFALDAPVIAALTDAPSWLSKTAAQITWIGNTAWQAIVLAVLMLTFALVRPDPRSAVQAKRLLQLTTACFLLVLLTGIAVQLLKHGFGRPRPNVLGPLSPYTFAPLTFQANWNAFPSGHATTMGALAVFFGRVLPRAKWVAIAVAILVAVSRVLVGKHYPSDVIAGLALGAVLAIWMLDRWQQARVIPKSGHTLGFPKLGRGPLSGLLAIPRSFARQLAALVR